MKRVLFVIAMLVMIFSFRDIHSQDMQQIMSRITDPTKSAEYKPEYKFDAYIQMEMTTFGKSGGQGEKVLYDSYMTKGGGTYAMVFTMQGIPTSIIFDAENSALLLLTANEGEKAGMVMAVNPEAIRELAGGSGKVQEEDPYKAARTGKTKTILGYSCDEYLIKDESSETRVWASGKLAEEVGLEMLRNQQAFGGAFSHAIHMDGMVMEFELNNKGNGEKIVMKAVSIDLNNPHTISTGGYQVMSLGQLPQF